jgi:hypothetical protein
VGSLREAFGWKYLAVLVIVAAALLWVKYGRETTPEVTEPTVVVSFDKQWLYNDSLVRDFIIKSVHTSYNLTSLYDLVYSSGAEYVGYFGPASGVYYRGFTMYKFDPNTTPDDDNWRVDGYVTSEGHIGLRQMRAGFHPY